MSRPPKPEIVDYARHLLVCTGRSCVADGMDADRLTEVGKKLIAAGLLDDGELRVKPSRVDCLGACRSGPVMCVQPDGVWYWGVGPADFDRIIDEHLIGGRAVDELGVPPRPGQRSRMSETRRQPGDPAPVYEVHVFACTNQRPATHRRGCCASKGSEALANYMCRRGMVTARGRHIRINLSGCLNLCEYGPVLVVYPEGVWYRYETEADIEEILDRHVLRGQRVTRLMVTPDLSRMHR